MSIELNKPESGGSQGAGPNYADPNFSDEVRQIYHFAYECKQKGMPDYQIGQALQNKGLTFDEAQIVSNIVSRAYQDRNEASSDAGGGGGGGIPRVVIYIAILVGINLLSAMFGWGFWIY